MTTLAERREWARDGCPMEAREEVASEPLHLPLHAPGEWEGFALTVSRYLDGVRGELHGRCLGCGARRRWTGLTTTKAPLKGVIGQVKEAQEWMVDHAMERHGLRGRMILARETYGHGRTRLWIWAAQIMARGESINGGWVAAPGSPKSGFYLYGDPSKWAEAIPSLKGRGEAV